MKQKLIFDIPTKQIMNSNKVIAHFMQKSTAVANLREIAAKLGIEEHLDPVNAAERMRIIRSIQKISNEKGKARRKMQKAKADEEEILLKLAKIERDLQLDVTLEDVSVEYMFNKFKLRLTVCPPTRRRLDPPNLYPTLKALIDGLTDAGWWEDDNFMHLLEVSFRYGGLSGIKDTYRLIIDIEEVDEISDYIMLTEVHEGGKHE